MGGVRDELALANECGLTLSAGGVERAEHRRQGAGEFCDLILGFRMRNPERRVTGALDLAGDIREFGDRPHRALSHQQTGEQRQHGARENAGGRGRSGRC